jgi:hypothetical protein
MASDVLERIQQGSLLFSIFSLCTCVLITLLIIFQKQLRSITFTFLMCIFGSEIVQSIGNIIIDKNNIEDDDYLHKNLTALCFISVSDMFTNLLLVFFTYSSIKLIKETNKLIKKSVPKFIIISGVISVLYMVAFLIVAYNQDKSLDIRFRGFYSEEDKDRFSKEYYILSSIHIFIIIVLSIISMVNTCVVLSFLANKQQNDKVNAKSIARLIKILRRYPLSCILYWAFLIPRLIFVATSGQKHILRDSLYFISESLFRLRGFLIFLNTIRSSKILLIFYKIIQVNIKHNCLLNLKICRKKRRPSLRSKSKSDEIERPLMV